MTSHDDGPGHNPTPEPLEAPPEPSGFPPGQSGSPEPQRRRIFYDADELTPESRGAWLVRSRRTSHIFDLDAGLYRREPDTSAQRFEADHTWLTLNRIEVCPRVGSRFLIWLDHPVDPAWEYWRISSTVRAILGTRVVLGPAPPAPPAPPAWPALPDNLPSHLAPPFGREGWTQAGRSADGDAADAAPATAAPSSLYPAVGTAGRWHVTTLDSDYALDLDAGTATRTPGSTAQPLAGDGGPVGLLSVVKAQLGEPLVLRLDLGTTTTELARSPSADDDQRGRGARTAAGPSAPVAPPSASRDINLGPPRLVFRYGTPVLRIRPIS